jgi:ribose-phosphate pyrophosphokinase
MIYINGSQIEFKNFPNNETLVNETQIKNAISSETNTVGFKYENDKDLIHLMFLKRYLDEHQIKSKLVIYYMPYSRMDRLENDSAFTLKYVADFINSLNFLEIVVIEPHSDVTPALLHNSKALFPSIDIFDKARDMVGFDINKDYVYFPDAGAEKRYGKKIGNFKQLVGFKNRDFATGRITRLDILGEASKDGFKVIMLDDLCSRGGTFQLGAEKLKAMGATEIYLVVGHCENTIYDGDIFKTNLINKVFTTNSIITTSGNEKIKIYDIIGGMVIWFAFSNMKRNY